MTQPKPVTDFLGKLRPRTIVVKYDVLTTGQAAKVCRVAPRTVSKWCDSGRLPNYKIPKEHPQTPGKNKSSTYAGDRRIKLTDMITFMIRHGMDVPPQLSPSTGRVLACGVPEPDLFLIDDAVEHHTTGLVRGVDAASAFEMGRRLARPPYPELVVVGDLEDVKTGAEIAREWAANMPFTDSVVLLIPDDQPLPEIDRVFVTRRPVDWSVYAERLRDAITRRAGIVRVAAPPSPAPDDHPGVAAEAG